EAEERGLRGRPAPDMFLAAARDVDVPPEEAIVFDDGVAGVRAGRAGRFGLVVGVDRRESGEGLAENGAHVVVSDLRALLDGREPLVTPDEVRPFLPWVEPDPRWTVRVRGDELAQRRPFQSIL